jgi:hypothetical protein
MPSHSHEETLSSQHARLQAKAAVVHEIDSVASTATSCLGGLLSLRDDNLSHEAYLCQGLSILSPLDTTAMLGRLKGSSAQDIFVDGETIRYLVNPAHQHISLPSFLRM